MALLLDNLVSYWSLDEASGTRADSHGTNHLTDNNTVTSATGVQSNAAVFAAANTEYLSVANNTSLQISSSISWGFSFWFKLTTAGANRAIIGRFDGGSGLEFLVLANSLGGVDFRLYFTPSGLKSIFSSAVALDAWHFVTCRHTPGHMILRINDDVVVSSTYSGTVAASTSDFKIGANVSNSWKFDGAVDELLFVKNYAPTLADHNYLYNAGAGRTYSGLSSAPSAPVQIICDGDSLTSGYGLSASDSYPSQLQGLLSSEYGVMNYGETSDTINLMSADAATQIDILLDTQATNNILCAWGGTNDIYGGDSAATAYSDYVTYCQDRQTAGFEVAAFTMLPRSGVGTPGTFETDRQTFNSLVRTNWATFADYLVDVAADTRIGDNGDETDTNYYQGDNVHLNAAGMGIIAALVVDEIAPSGMTIPIFAKHYNGLRQ